MKFVGKGAFQNTSQADFFFAGIRLFCVKSFPLLPTFIDKRRNKKKFLEGNYGENRKNGININVSETEVQIFCDGKIYKIRYLSK